MALELYALKSIEFSRLVKFSLAGVFDFGRFKPIGPLFVQAGLYCMVRVVAQSL